MYRSLFLPMGFFISLATFAQTPVDIQRAKQLERSNSLGSCDYTPVDREKPFLHRIPEKERVTGSAFGPPFTILGKKGTYVSWFGIVRGISSAAPDGKTIDLLVEQKYFDGLTDCHIMLVAFTGSGDFRASIEADPQSIPALSLVKVYGRVVDEADGVPHIAVEYMRVWPWLSFTFSDLGAEDHSNPRWAQYCQTCKRKGKIHDPWPLEPYYRQILGNPDDFGVHLTDPK
jgi:hypothetical protein